MQLDLHGTQPSAASIRGLRSLCEIRELWGQNFHIHIHTWPVLASVHLLTFVLRVVKSTSLTVFTGRSHEIVAARMKTHYVRGISYKRFVTVCDYEKYEKQWPSKKQKR